MTEKTSALGALKVKAKLARPDTAEEQKTASPGFNQKKDETLRRARANHCSRLRCCPSARVRPRGCVLADFHRTTPPNAHASHTARAGSAIRYRETNESCLAIKRPPMPT